MNEMQPPIADEALSSLSVAPPDPDAQADAESGKTACDPRQQAGQDESIAARLTHDPACADAKLDRGLDESMDASDPPSAVQPGESGEPAASSGYDEGAEAARRA